MTYVFELTDKNGRKIHLSKERWEHITITHENLANYLDELKQTLENPLKITFHEKGDLRNYYSYLKHRNYPEKYLKVIVKYLNEHGFVLTSHFVSYIK